MPLKNIYQIEGGTSGVAYNEGKEVFFTTADGQYKDIYPLCASVQAADINVDGYVNMLDVQKFINAVKGYEEKNRCYDLNADGIVDQRDVDRLIRAINSD